MGTQKTVTRVLKNITYKERLREWGLFFWKRREETKEDVIYFPECKDCNKETSE